MTLIYSVKVSEENQGALEMVARGQDRLSGSLNDVRMKRVFDETAECEEERG